MAIFRPIQISFWQDPYILELNKDQRYFYLYLMTNSRTTQCGIYQISYKVINFETDIETGAIEGLIRGFIDDGKILFNNSKNEIMLLNWIKYNPINNMNLEKRVLKELKEVKTPEFVSMYIRLLEREAYNTPIIQGAYKGLSGGLDDPSKKSSPSPTSTSSITPSPSLSIQTNPATPSPSIKKIIDSISANINPNISPIEIELVQKWIEEHPEEIIIEAIKETAIHKATSLRYTDRILITWKNKNIKTIQDLERMRNQKNKPNEKKEPEWLEKHEEYRQSVSEQVEEVDLEETKRLLESFKKKE